MLNESSNTEPKPRQWGPIAAILWGIVAFVGAQLLVATLFATVGVDYDDGNSEQFYIYGASSIVTLVILSLILRHYRADFKDIGLRNFKISHIGYALLALPIYFVLTAFFSSLAAIFFTGLDLEQTQDLGFTNSGDPLELAMVFVALVVLPPLVEELLFRGFILKGFLKNMRFFGAALFTSILFGVAHGQWNVAIDTFALSIVLCYLVQKTGTIWPSIFLHAFKNFIAYFFLFIMTPEQLQEWLNRTI